MKSIITAEQMTEIIDISREHHDALIAFGADMYRSGIYRGALIAMAGFGIGLVAGFGIGLVASVIYGVLKKK